MKKNYTFNLDIDNMDRIKQMVIFPCSYSNLIDAMIEYLLQSPYAITAMIQTELNKVKIKIESVPE
jgi:hypothetical protein